MNTDLFGLCAVIKTWLEDRKFVINDNLKPRRTLQKPRNTTKISWNRFYYPIIKPNQDWSDFQNEINRKFFDWNIDEYDSVDDIWNSWKENIIQAANQSIGPQIMNSSINKVELLHDFSKITI